MQEEVGSSEDRNYSIMFATVIVKCHAAFSLKAVACWMRVDTKKYVVETSEQCRPAGPLRDTMRFS